MKWGIPYLEVASQDTKTTVSGTIKLPNISWKEFKDATTKISKYNTSKWILFNKTTMQDRTSFAFECDDEFIYRMKEGNDKIDLEYTLNRVKITLSDVAVLRL
jgi:hypothetical protein